MDSNLVEQYWRQYGEKYLSGDIESFYPETKIIPKYIMESFPEAKTVLDLGFGTGLWFWASFLPGLARLDGIDLNPEALAAADRILVQDGVPEGLELIQKRLGRTFAREDLDSLAAKRGAFYFFDYTSPWPADIKRNYYDLITEHGGGFGEMKSEYEIRASVKHCLECLKTDGCLLFVNFQMKPNAGSPAFRMNGELLIRVLEQAGMGIVDFQTTTFAEQDRITSSIEKLVYGYARKPNFLPE